MDELFSQLKCTKEGLTSDEGKRRLGIFGPNKLEEKKVNYSNLKLQINRFYKNKSYFTFVFYDLGKQTPKVLGVHVESSIMGHGSCCYYGHCLSERRGNIYINIYLQVCTYR